MSTRLYLHTGYPGYTPPTIRGAWNMSNPSAYPMDENKVSTSGTWSTTETSASTIYALLTRFVSPPLTRSVSFLTSDHFSLCFGALESASAASLFMAYYIYVTVGDTDVVRGRLDGMSTVGVYFPTTAAGLAAIYSTFGGAVSAQAGDRIVIELGYQAGNTDTTPYTGTVYFGGNGPDLTEGDTAVTTHPGWFEVIPYDNLFSTPSRLYLQNAYPSYTPSSIRGSWDATYQNTNAKAMSPAKVGESGWLAQTELLATPGNFLVARFVSPPLPADRNFYSAYDRIRMCIGAQANAAAGTDTLTWYVYVTAGDTNTVRCTLLGQTTESTSESFETTVPVARGTGWHSVGADCAAYAGDHIVLEVGYYSPVSDPTTNTGTLYFGGRDALDLYPYDTAVTTHPGWIDFSQECLFTSPTKLYLRNASPSLVVNVDPSGWNIVSANEYAMEVAPGGGAACSAGVTETSATPVSALLGVFVSPALPENKRFVAGVDRVRLCMAATCGIGDSSMNGHLAYTAWVTTGNTSTRRGYLIGAISRHGDLFTDQRLGQQSDWYSVPTTFEAQAGDHIVLEVGYYADNTETSAHTGYIYFGGTGAALRDEDSTLGAPPWMEFSQGHLLSTTTRLYFQNAAPGYTPPTIRGGWDGTNPSVRAIGTAKSGASGSTSHSEMLSSPSGLLVIRYVSDALKANRVFSPSGDQVRLCAGSYETSVDANMFLEWYAYVTQGDSDVVRGVLIPLTIEDSEISTSAQGHEANWRAVAGPFTAYVGDRIVLEAGIYADNTSTSVYTAYFYYGATGGDLYPTDAGVTTDPGWIEFNIAGLMSAAVSHAGSLASSGAIGRSISKVLSGALASGGSIAYIKAKFINFLASLLFGGSERADLGYVPHFFIYPEGGVKGKALSSANMKLDVEIRHIAREHRLASGALARKDVAIKRTFNLSWEALAYLDSHTPDAGMGARSIEEIAASAGIHLLQLPGDGNVSRLYHTLIVPDSFKRTLAWRRNGATYWNVSLSLQEV